MGGCMRILVCILLATLILACSQPSETTKEAKSIQTTPKSLQGKFELLGKFCLEKPEAFIKGYQIYAYNGKIYTPDGIFESGRKVGELDIKDSLGLKAPIIDVVFEDGKLFVGYLDRAEYKIRIFDSEGKVLNDFSSGVLMPSSFRIDIYNGEIYTLGSGKVKVLSQEGKVLREGAVPAAHDLVVDSNGIYLAGMRDVLFYSLDFKSNKTILKDVHPFSLEKTDDTLLVGSSANEVITYKEGKITVIKKDTVGWTGEDLNCVAFDPVRGSMVIVDTDRCFFELKVVD
ncbi:hypothetical protein DRP07_07855 [Archaeoglobales archaeon]|nr:MAG: hypothetical protein DRP07_07855 [Archaeoglobales archaeon]